MNIKGNTPASRIKLSPAKISHSRQHCSPPFENRESLGSLSYDGPSEKGWSFRRINPYFLVTGIFRLSSTLRQRKSSNSCFSTGEPFGTPGPISKSESITLFAFANNVLLPPLYMSTQSLNSL